MNRLDEVQTARQQAVAALVAERVSPLADAWDRAEATPREIIAALGQAGFLGAPLPAPWGGAWDALSLGLLYEGIGGGSASLLSLFAVQSMVEHALIRWGSAEQQARWLPALATGEVVGAFCLTEPDIGCDARNVSTTLTPAGQGYRLNGSKTWISYAQVAGLYLVFAQLEGQPVACLVAADQPGVSVTPLTGMLGFRAAQLATLRFQDVEIAPDALVGRPGFGFSHVAGSALDLGRYCIAWGATGLAGAATQCALAYAQERYQFGVTLGEHPLVQGLLADMVADWRAARALCVEAAAARGALAPDSIVTTTTAKYVASRTAVRVTGNGVQVLGAAGCRDDRPAARYYRDAKLFDIIEGSNQMQQIMIARHYLPPRRRNRT